MATAWLVTPQGKGLAGRAPTSRRRFARRGGPPEVTPMGRPTATGEAVRDEVVGRLVSGGVAS